MGGLSEQEQVLLDQADEEMAAQQADELARLAEVERLLKKAGEVLTHDELDIIRRECGLN